MTSVGSIGCRARNDVVGLLASAGVSRLREERDEIAAAIDEIVEAAKEEGPISGVSVGVARGPRVVHSAGYGFADLENQLPATPETVYRLGSITKQFTAAAVACRTTPTSAR